MGRTHRQVQLQGHGIRNRRDPAREAERGRTDRQPALAGGHVQRQDRVSDPRAGANPARLTAPRRDASGRGHLTAPAQQHNIVRKITDR